MKKKKIIKISIFVLLTLVAIGILYPILAKFKNSNEIKYATSIYQMLKSNNDEIKNEQTNQVQNDSKQKVKTISNEATQDYELPNVKITIKKQQNQNVIEKLLGEDLTIDANVSINGAEQYYDDIKYEWFRVGRMEGTASVYNIVEGQDKEDLTLKNLTFFNSAKYQLAVSFYKDGQPLKKKGSEDVFKVYSEQIGVNVYRELNIDILGDNNSPVGDTIDINYGEQYKFSADVYRLNDNNLKVKTFKDVIWETENVKESNEETSNEEVISIDKSGLITPHKYNRKAKVIAKVKDINGEYREDTVIVNVKKVPVKSITFDDTEITLKKEQTTKINAKIEPENATIKEIKWEIIEGNDIISIDEQGMITAKEYGDAVVKATVDGQEATCTIHVPYPKVEKITDDVTDHHIYITENQKLEIHTNVHPLDANQNLKWESFDTSVATVKKVNGQNGMITAKEYKNGKTEKENTCTIRVSSEENPDIYIDYEVTVVKDAQPITGLKLNKEEVSIKVGEEFDFNIEIEPEDATYSLVEWKIDDVGIASIDDSGVVRGEKIGTATVTVTVTCDEPKCLTHKQTATVHVVKTDVTKVEISKNELTLRVGDEENLTAEVLPYDATNRDVIWESENSKIVDVDQNGKITAVSPGTATIRVKSKDNEGKLAECKVTVTPIKVEEIEISDIDKEITLKEGQEYKIEAKIYPEIASDKKIIWKSSNDNVATVDQEGNIKAIKEGTAIIKVVSDEDESIYQECVVTVVPLKTNVTIYTVDQNKNFISGLKLKLTNITNEGEKDVTELAPTKGKYEIKGLENGEYKISVVGEIPNKDINGKEINIVDVVKDYTFVIKDGKVLYIITKDKEIDVLYTNTLVLTNIVDYPDVEGETNGLSAKVGIGEDFTIKNKTIDEQYKEYDEKNPIAPENPQQPNTTDKSDEPEQPENTENTDNLDEDAQKEPNTTEEQKTDNESEDEELPDTSDTAIEVYIGIMIVSLLGILYIINKKRN